MSDLRTAAQQALEALEGKRFTACGWRADCDKAITALKTALVENAMQKFADVNQEIEAALAEPVQEPVAWIGYINGVANDLAFEPFDLDSDVKKPLYTSPPILTDDQLDDIAVAARTGNLYDLRIAIEQAHGII